MAMCLFVSCKGQLSDYSSTRNITYSDLNEIFFKINKTFSERNDKGRSDLMLTNELPKEVVPNFSEEESSSNIFWSYYNSEVS